MAVNPDVAFASEVRAQVANGCDEFLVAANAYQCRIYCKGQGSMSWTDLGTPDIDTQTLQALESVANAGKLSWIELAESAKKFVLKVPRGTPVDHAHLNAWLKEREEVTAGRTGDADAKTQFEVASLAAWRCQLEGCGEDLRAHFVGGSRGNYSYFAHIIASSPKGPRGDPYLSPRKANDPENIMLLCDKCHRLIDRVDPDNYDDERLNGMRERNIREVRRLLDSLRFPAAQMIVIGGNIEGQSAGFNVQAAERAMWERKLRTANFEPFWFLRNGTNLTDSTRGHFWEALFESLRTELPALQNYLNGTSTATGPASIRAVFPTHVTSIQILAGRVLGNSTTTHIFQPNRNFDSARPSERWGWPSDASPPGKDKFQRIESKPFKGGQEAALVLSLTADLSESEFPWQASNPEMPTQILRAKVCSHAVIGTPEDLELLAVQIDDSLRILQDTWKVETVHLLAIAPSSACVLLGQKLQARHQAKFILYERQRDPRSQGRGPLLPTIAISGSKVELVGSGKEVVIG